jgi:hypothetical protein
VSRGRHALGRHWPRAGGSLVFVDYHLDRGDGVATIRDIRHRFGHGVLAIYFAPRTEAAEIHSLSVLVGLL